MQANPLMVQLPTGCGPRLDAWVGQNLENNQRENSPAGYQTSIV